MLKITPNFAQERALNMLRQEWKNFNSFMVYAPTGAGKTGLSAFITRGFVSKGMKVMMICPYLVLINQTAQRFIEYGLPEDEIAYIWRDHPNQDPSKLIQIASADTLIRRDFPENINLLVIDEAHLKRKKILEEITRLTSETDCKVVGLSGTPFSPFLGHYYQKLIKPTTIKELIQRGDLSAYEFYAPTKPDLSKVKSARNDDYGSDYKEDEIAEIMCGADLVGDVVSSWLKLGENQPTICFCVNVSHANFITVEFNRAGINAEIMTANTPQDERDLIIHQFGQGATKIIVNVGVLVAGFDSDVRCIIYARPTKSEIRWLQSIGNRQKIITLYSRMPELKGTSAEKYLQRRGIYSHHPIEQIRFCEKQPTYKGDYQAMWALATDARGQLCYLHRTYLDGEKKAPLEVTRKMMSLQEETYLDHAQSVAIRMFPVASTLGIAEGIETALSCKQIYKVNTWSTMNAGHMAKFIAPRGVKHLIIFADNDWSATGEAAAYACANKNLLANNDIEKVSVRYPDLGDFNDLLQQGCQAREREYVKKQRETA